MAISDLAWIRLKTTDDNDVLPDWVIIAFLDEHDSESTTANQRNLALADCYEYMAREDVYESYSRGGISVGRNVLHERAAKLRAEVGVSIETDTLSVAKYADSDGDYQ